MPRISVTRSAPLLALGLAAPALAQSRFVTNIIHVNIAGHPTNVVPGLGIPFKTGTTAFERPTYSGTGLHFAINALADSATTDDDILIMDNAVILREGAVAPWSAAENVGTIDADFGVNDLGQLLIGNNTSAASNDDVVVIYSGGVWTELAREAGLISAVVPGLVGDAGNTGTWDDAIDTCRISNLGSPIWRAEGCDNLTTALVNDELLVLGPGFALQEGVDIPAGQAGGATNAWENFSLEDTYVSPDGSVLITQGDLLGATTGDDVIVVNGAVVLQENSIIPGSSFVNPIDTTGFVKCWVDNGNNWYVRGNNDVTEDDWVVRNGIVVADSTGTDEIVAGSGEHWTARPVGQTFTDCFFAFDGNALGQYVIGGVTDNPKTLLNGVLVVYDGLGNDFVAVRESDPVDLNGNGLFDDNCFYNTFGNDDVLLQNDGTLVFTATLKDGAGASLGQGVFRLVPRTASCTFRNGSGINPVALSCITLPIVGSTWQIGLTNGPNTLATFLFADPTPIPAFPLFGGELLIAPTAFQIGTSLPLPFGYQGLDFSLQGIRVDFNGVDILFVLTNAQDVVLGY